MITLAHIVTPRKFARCWLLMAMLAGCASAQPLQPFSTDGCSMFPDHSLIGKADWCDCCTAHDLAYWHGGTAEERLKADQELKACVLNKTGDEKLADIMFAGVRSGGGPYFYTHYRWGYGWPYGRGYAPLTPEEKEIVKKRENEYLTRNPRLSCPTE